MGFAIAKVLLEKFGANVVALSRTRGADLQSLVDAHKEALLALEVDVYVYVLPVLCLHPQRKECSTDGAAVRSAVSRGVEKYKTLDSVILNAGVLEPLGNIASEDITIDQWKRHFDTNFFSLVEALRATLPELRTSSFGGRVVFISSGAATGNTPGWGPYNAGKAAMNSLCRYAV